MSKKFTFLTLLLTVFLTANSFAQEADSVFYYEPDLKEIENIVKNHRNVYDSLTVCFKNMDSSTMFTIQEAQIIYYGFAFTEGYSPYSNAEADIVSNYLKEGEIDKAEAAVKEFLVKNPVLLELYEYQLTIAKRKQDEETYRKAWDQLTMLLDIISDSGDGHTKESPLYVIRVSDEYSVLRCIGATQLLGQALVDSPSGACDKMDFKLDEETSKEAGKDSFTLYFNIDLAFSKLSSIF